MDYDGGSVGTQVELQSLQGFKGQLADDGSDCQMRETFNDFVSRGHVVVLFCLVEAVA